MTEAEGTIWVGKVVVQILGPVKACRQCFSRPIGGSRVRIHSICKQPEASSSFAALQVLRPEASVFSTDG